jgi:hypothetical protein
MPFSDFSVLSKLDTIALTGGTPPSNAVRVYCAGVGMLFLYFIVQCWAAWAIFCERPIGGTFQKRWIQYAFLIVGVASTLWCRFRFVNMLRPFMSLFAGGIIYLFLHVMGFTAAMVFNASNAVQKANIAYTGTPSWGESDSKASRLMK